MSWSPILIGLTPSQRTKNKLLDSCMSNPSLWNYTNKLPKAFHHFLCLYVMMFYHRPPQIVPNPLHNKEIKRIIQTICQEHSSLQQNTTQKHHYPTNFKPCWDNVFNCIRIHIKKSSTLLNKHQWKMTLHSFKSTKPHKSHCPNPNI